MPYGRYRRRRTRSVGRYRSAGRRRYRRKAMSYRKKRRTRSAPLRRRKSRGKYGKKRRRSSKRSNSKKTFGSKSRKTLAKQRRVTKQANLACPVVAECIRKISGNNFVYNILNLTGDVQTTVDKFASTAAQFRETSGPFNGAQTIDERGYMGIPIYWDPAAHTAGMVQTFQMNPGNINYRFMPFGTNLFPIIAKTNPAASVLFTNDSCRTKDRAFIKSYDNRHSVRICWPAIDSSAARLNTYIQRQSLMFHEVVWRIPDLATVENNSLLVTATAQDTAAEAQVLLRVSRKWQRQMYNAYFPPHPLADADVVDNLDITTGATTFPIDTFNEDEATNARLTDQNMRLRPKDTKMYLAKGVLDRRKDAKVVWQRKKLRRRPRTVLGVNRNVDTAVANVSLQQECRIIKLGHKFNINATMTWEKITETSVPDDALRKVCPRGVYLYVCYIYFTTQGLGGVTQATTLAPDLLLSETGTPSKTHRLVWQNEG